MNKKIIKERIDKKQKEEFKQLADPLIKYINDNYDTHTTIIITNAYAEMVRGEQMHVNHEYLKD